MRSDYSVRSEYIGTGSKSDYTFDFKIVEKAHLLIKCVDDEFEEVFTVRGDDLTDLSSVVLNDDAGGTVNLTDPLPNGYHLIILLDDHEPKQPKRFGSTRTFTMKALEDAFDWLSGQIQRLTYISKRTLKLTDSYLDSEDAFDMTMPRPEAQHVLITKSTNDGWEWISRADLKGDKGDAATVAIGTVTTVEYVDGADVVNSGDDNNAIFDFEIPAGPAATIQVGTVTTGLPSDPAEVTNVGDSSNAIFDFVIPKGDKGDSSYAIYTEATDPTALDGADLDIWINTTSGNLYQKAAGAWVLEGNIKGPSGAGFPTGGTTGQVLRKLSNTDYDTEWATEGTGNQTIRQIVGDDTLTTNDKYVIVNSASAVNVTLPVAPADGVELFVKCMGGGEVTIVATVDGGANPVLNPGGIEGTAVNLISYGGGWYVW